ncbi:protein FAM151A-like isoform X2 [Artemia franciscana]
MTEALESNIDFLEADISLGQLNGTGPEIPIMAHPPVTDSDLSLAGFLDMYFEANSSKGMKLDFKDISVLEDSLLEIKSRDWINGVELWLNADILPGPNNNYSEPVSAEEFLSRTSFYFPEATLSVGWKTDFGRPADSFSWSCCPADSVLLTHSPRSFLSLFISIFLLIICYGKFFICLLACGDTCYGFGVFQDIRDGDYSFENIEEMIDVLRHCNITQPVTFPVRAGIAASPISQKTLPYLLSQIPGSTLTFWSASQDCVDYYGVASLINSIGRSKSYIDVPANQRDKIFRYLS